MLARVELINPEYMKIVLLKSTVVDDICIEPGADLLSKKKIYLT